MVYWTTLGTLWTRKGDNVEHILWILIVIFVQQGEPRINAEVVKSTFNQQECRKWAQDYQQKVGDMPNVRIGCLPAKHGMVW